MNPIFDELKLTGNLPSPSGVGLQILQLTQNEDFAAEDLAQTIQSDPALTGRLIKMSNSAQVGGVKEIATVGEAVVRLGVSAVRNVALGFSLVSSYRSGKCQAFDFGRFWSESLARAIVAQSIARESKSAPPAEVYICGLLASIGKLALATVHPQTYAELLAANPNVNDDRIAQLETERFGIQHREVAAAMLADWKLPEAHRKAVLTVSERTGRDLRNDDLAGKLRRILRIASPIAQIFLANVKDIGPLFQRLDAVRTELPELDVDMLHRLADQCGREWQDWGKLLSLPTQRVAAFKELADAARQIASQPATAPAEEPVPTALPAAAAQPANVAKPPSVEASIDQVFERWKSEELRREDMIVLAADDDPITRRILGTHLRKVGFQVVEAKDGKEALAKALEHNPHIVITDWQMPEMDGVSVCARLRNTEFGRKMYVLVLTGVDDEGHVIQAFEAGADDYVSKPVNPPVLLARVTAGERLARLQDRVEKDHLRMRDHLAQMAILNRKLRQTAVTDALTNLPNRRFAMKLLEELFSRPVSASERCAVVAIDIDHFKKINDTYGHDIGDVVLREISGVLARNLRATDRVCRIGGEEFLVICPGADVQTASKIADRLRVNVAEHSIRAGKFDGKVTISVGVAQRGDTMSHYDDVLKCADEALYASKHAGRNRVTVFAAA